MTSPLFSYRKGGTPLHRLPAAAKLAAQLALCIALFARPSSKAMETALHLFCGGTIALAFAAAKMKAGDLKKLKIILFLGAICFAFRVFSISLPPLQEGEGFKLLAKGEEGPVFLSAISIRTSRIPSALLYIYRFFMAALSAMIFFETTTPLQVKEAFEQIQEAIAKIFPPLRRLNPALVLALALNFIPQVFSTWDRIDRAAKARGAESRGGAFFAASLGARLEALLSCLMRHAETTRRAIANRSG